MTEGFAAPSAELRPPPGNWGDPRQLPRRLSRASLLLALLLYGAAYAHWSLTTRLSSADRSFRSDLAFLPVGAVVVVLAVLASRAPALDRRSRRAWVLIASALCLFWLGDLLWFASSWIWREPAHSGIVYGLGQVAYLCYYPTLLAGLLSFPRFLRTGADRAQFWLDVATVFLGGLMLLWSVLLAPIVAAGSSDRAALALAIAYPMGDLVLLFGIAVISARRRNDQDRIVFLLLTGAIAATLLNDSFFSVVALAGGYQSGGTVDLISMAAWLLFAASADAQRRHAADSGGAAAAAPEQLATTVSVTPYVAVAVGYGTLFLTAFGDRAVYYQGVVVGAIALTAVVLLRQYVAVRENARLSAATAARESEARFRALVQNSSDMIAVVDDSAVIRYQTPSVQRLLGYRPEELAGARLTAVLHPEDHARALATISKPPSQTGPPAPLEWRFRRRSGDWFFAEVIVTNLLAEPTVSGIVLTIRDIQERKAFENQLTHQAFHDPLTHLANRALLSDRVMHAQARSRRDGRPCAVLLMDLDDFKTINDTLGHPAGDAVLMEVGRRLRDCVRAGDTAARLGGDEFALLLEDTASPAAAREVAERIGASLDSPVTLNGREVFLSACVGIAIAGPGDQEGELLRNADVALYAAKARGKGLCEVYEPGMRSAAMERMQLESDLRRAIERRELVLHYQPIFDLASRRIMGAEALVRWRHSERGLLAPGAFIPLAEETGLIVPIGQWVVEEACRRIRALAPDGEMHVSVNLSARQLQEPNVVEVVADALRGSGLSARRLVLEVTETLIMVEPRTMIPRLRALKELGVRLAIDDFGTGYSSLAYLQNLPVDVLKIDRSFLQLAGPAADLSPLARGVVDLGRAMGLVMVAEGIELADQASALASAGCTLGQGFFLGRPMEPEQLGSLLASRAEPTY